MRQKQEVDHARETGRSRLIYEQGMKKDDLVLYRKALIQGKRSAEL